MRPVLLLSLIFFNVKLVAQTTAKHSTSHSYDFLFGYNIYSDKKNTPLNTIENFKLHNPIRFVGFGASSGATDLKFKKSKSSIVIAQNIYFQFLIPAFIRQDTVDFKCSGFNFNLGYGKSLHSQDHHYNLIAYFGFNTGRLVLKSNEFSKQQLLFFNPKIGIQPKVIIGRFALSLISEYQFDLLKSSWKNSSFKNENNFPVRTFNQSAISLAVCIGYHVHY